MFHKCFKEKNIKLNVFSPVWSARSSLSLLWAVHCFAVPKNKMKAIRAIGAKMVLIKGFNIQSPLWEEKKLTQLVVSVCDSVLILADSPVSWKVYNDQNCIWNQNQTNTGSTIFALHFLPLLLNKIIKLLTSCFFIMIKQFVWT